MRFEVPQPEGGVNERSIPRKLIGRYLDLQDSALLMVTGREIIRTSAGKFSSHISELDSANRAVFKQDTTIMDYGDKTKMDIRFKDDSIYFWVNHTDTIFSIPKGNVLRKFKGHYFLSCEKDKDSWRVTKLTLMNNRLAVGSIETKEDIDKLREATETQVDTIYHFRPTRKQLKKFLKTPGFQSGDTYIRID